MITMTEENRLNKENCIRNLNKNNLGRNLRMKKKVIVIVILFCVLVLLLMVFLVPSSVGLVHGAKWSEDMEDVIERERKIDSEAKISLFDGFVAVESVLYEQECSIGYSFGEDNKLEKIVCSFNTSKGASFDELSSKIEEIYGKEIDYKDFGSISQTKTWMYKDNMIVLKYTPNDENSNYDWYDITITYVNQGK